MDKTNYEIINESSIGDDIQVSIYCLAYNHEKYIATAIESFLMQETSFRYMIYIHDDASTDGTPNIIREYAAKYPDKIVAVLQKENQYSMGIKIVKTFLRPLFRGQYIAMCEGDDFWIHEKKLQKQFDFMKRYPKCTFCAHGGVTVNADTCKPLSKNTVGKAECFFSIEDAIAGLGRKLLTNSFFYCLEILDDQPEYRVIAPCGDYPLPVCCAEKGVLGYLPEIMSAYRVTSNAQSVTTAMRSNTSYRKRYTERFDAMLRSLDQHTKMKYAPLIEKERQRIWMNYYIQAGDNAALKKEPYEQLLKAFPLRKKVVTFLELNFPRLIAALRKWVLAVRLLRTEVTIGIRNEDSSWLVP